MVQKAELHGKIYAPLHDRQGHLVCLLDAKTGQPAETYRYSAFGEETILNAQGNPMADSQVGNPWRFACKRVDPETGWIYFGQRYYDPEIGRWTTPDPAGFIDGPNLYAYLHHNPLMSFDAFGLLGEGYRESCEVARNSPNYANFSISDRQEPSFFSADSERAGYIGSGSNHRTAGFLHGCVDFFSNLGCDLALGCCLVGSNDWDDSFDRCNFIYAYHDWQTTQRDAFDDKVVDALGIDPNNHTYQSYRYYTTLGIEVGTLAGGACGIAKGGFKAIKSSRWFLPKEGSKIAGQIARKELKSIVNLGVKVGEQNPSNVPQLAERINGWLGEGTGLIKNKAGDPVFISKDGTKRIRFDFNNSHGDRPHMHIEIKINTKWKDATNQHRIYPYQE